MTEKDLTHTIVLRASLATALKKKYNATLEKVLKIIDRESPNTFAKVDSLFPAIAKELDISLEQLNKILKYYVKISFHRGKIYAQDSYNKMTGQTVAIGFNMRHERALNNVLRMGFNDVKNVNDDIKNNLRKSLYKSIELGEGSAGARKRIEGVFKELPAAEKKKFQTNVRITPEYRAQLIARTSIIKAYNNSAIEQLKQFGFEKKKWVSKLDSRTSSNCKELNGQVVGIDDYFSTKKGERFYSPPGHVNCRSLIQGVLR